MKHEMNNTFRDNEIATLFSMEGSSNNKFVFTNPFSRNESICRDKQIIYLNYFDNLRFRFLNKFIIIFLVIFNIIFIVFLLNYNETTNNVKTFIIINIPLILYFILYNITSLKVVISKTYIKFKNKEYYFYSFRKVDFDIEYKFVEIYFKNEYRKNRLDSIYPDLVIYFDNKYRAKAIEDYWKLFKSTKEKNELHGYFTNH